MDYNLDLLDERNFEHVVQALALDAVGQGLTVFGDGPDGGREASWSASSLSIGAISLDSYGVLQAKHRRRPSDSPASNYRWLLQRVAEDVERWAGTKHKRRDPSIYILATNVSIGSAAGAGKDSAPAAIETLFNKAGISAPTVFIWDRDDLRARLDANDAVTNQYAAWITPSTVLSKIVQEAADDEADLVKAIQLHAAASIKRDRNLKLSQTGTVRDETMSVADVFIDLPCTQGDAEFGRVMRQRSSKTAAGLAIAEFDTMHDLTSNDSYRQLVLVGGPGQGKSTVTQFLAQYYRALFLEDTPIYLEPVTKLHIRDLKSRAAAIQLPEPVARRWPIRINLPNLADALADRTADSVMGYIAKEITERSGIELTPKMFRRWLTRIPWAVIMDGLDEVPSSANRRQLFDALSTFTALGRASGADIVLIGTTRPQGYDGDFGDAKHVFLQPLPAATALAYADNFLLVRNGADYPENERTSKLLRTTIRDSASVRLFESPLQVTILAVLLEKLGHAPNNKWSLFSSYYTVILQREQEKPGPLAKLLQEFGPQITWLHRKVGSILQERGALAGSSESSLTNEEFRETVVDRLTFLGHEDAASDLADQLLTLATDRLVFLAMLTPNTVGFELRSFQEFMAGEQIVADLSESETLARLKGVGGDPYWRNTFLFAAGHIFQNREVLKASLLQITQELDVMKVDHEEVGRGRELALDLLAEDLCVSEPMMAKPLAKHASNILSSVNSERATALAALRDKAGRATVDDYLVTTAPSDLFDMIGRARFIAADPKLDKEQREGAIEELFIRCTDELKPRLIEWAWGEPNPSWARVARSYWHLLNPFTALVNPTRSRLEPENEFGAIWPALVALQEAGRSAPAEVAVLSGSKKTHVLNAGFADITSQREAWSAISVAESQTPAWVLLRAIGLFVIDPGPTTLANVGLSIPFDEPIPPSYSRVATPWPVSWLLEAMRGRSREYRSALVAAVRTERFGGLEEWTEAEEIFATEPILLEQLIVSSDYLMAPLPLSRIPLEALTLGAVLSDHEDGIQAQVDAALELLGVDVRDAIPAHQAELGHIATFILAMASDSIQRLSTDGRSATALVKSAIGASADILRQPSVWKLAAGGTAPAWLNWISLFTASELADSFGEDFLPTFGESPFYIVDDDDDLAQALVQKLLAKELSSNPGILAFIIKYSPALFSKVMSLAEGLVLPEPANTLAKHLLPDTRSEEDAVILSEEEISRLVAPGNVRLTLQVLRATDSERKGVVAATISRALRQRADLRAVDFNMIAQSSLNPRSTGSSQAWRFV